MEGRSQDQKACIYRTLSGFSQFFFNSFRTGNLENTLASKKNDGKMAEM